jgi:anaerobic selenocysteine-containing dehydrogenase
METDARTVTTFCRICEPSCGLVAHVEGGVLVKLSPDRDHPVTQGFSCHKGLAAVDVHNDPDRLDRPMLRAADGTWSDATWDEAMAHIATRLRAITAQHSDGAIGAYVGNPTSFNALGSLHVGQMLRGLGVGRIFSSGTQDCANKFVASEAVFSSSARTPALPRPASTPSRTCSAPCGARRPVARGWCS